MRIFLIRHAETTDNVAHVYAGVTDSPLTAYGFLQTERLGTHIKANFSPVTHIFASPLQRTRRTAEAILKAQNGVTKTQTGLLNGSTPTKSPNANDHTASGDLSIFFVDDLIEQDFGSHEGATFLSSTPKLDRLRQKAREAAKSGTSPKQVIGQKRKPVDEEKDDIPMTVAEEGPMDGTNDLGEVIAKKENRETEEVYKEIETPEAITMRTDRFVLQHLVSLLPNRITKLPLEAPMSGQESENRTKFESDLDTTGERVVVIVSHGILLSHLWRSISRLFHPSSVLATTPVVEKGWYQGKHPGWGNTGYLLLNVLSGNKNPASGDEMTVIIEGVNEKDHLKGLKRTGGGVGSAKYDEKQRKISSFFGGRTPSKVEDPLAVEDTEVPQMSDVHKTKRTRTE